MRSRDEEEAREAFRRMTPKAKAGYILHYYWWAFLLTAAVIAVTGYEIHRRITTKTPVLYTACMNLTIGSDLEEILNEGFLRHADLNEKKNEVLFYRNLYISGDPSAENHEMAYASKLKLMASINSKKLDLSLMNREAYDILSASDYLLDLSELSAQDEGLFLELEPFLTENTVVIEDNAIEFNLNEADAYQAVTKEVSNGIDISGISAIAEAGFSGSVYLGIIANTSRLAVCTEYLTYLLSLQKSGR